MLQDSKNFWKAFSASCWMWKWFPCKKLSRCSRYRDHVNMADEAKLCRPVRSTFEALVVQCVIECSHAEELGPFCQQYQLQALQFLLHLINLPSILLSCNGFTRIQKAVVDQLGSRPPTSDHDCLVQVCFGKCPGASSWSNHWVGCHWLSYKIHFLSHVTIWQRNRSLLQRVREDDASIWQFFWPAISSQGTFPICFKCRMTTEWSTLSPVIIHCVAVRGQASMTALNWSLSTSDSGHYTPHLQGSHLLCKTSWTTTVLYSVSSSWAKGTVDVVICLCWCMIHFELKLKNCSDLLFVLTLFLQSKIINSM